MNSIFNHNFIPLNSGEIIWRNKKAAGGFPGGSVVGNPADKAGDTGLVPGLGGSHVTQSNQAHAPQLLSSRAWELWLLKAMCLRAHAPQQEKPLQWEALTLKWEHPPLAANRDKPMQQ